MNRPIKFRAWDGDSGRMCEVRRLDLHEPKTALLAFHHLDGEYDVEEVALSLIELMQFTGLLDRNGKEIYEGDIIEVWEEVDRERLFSVKCEVTWWELVAGWWLGSVSRSLGALERKNLQAEVVGNIYENPELLEK